VKITAPASSPIFTDASRITAALDGAHRCYLLGWCELGDVLIVHACQRALALLDDLARELGSW